MINRNMNSEHSNNSELQDEVMPLFMGNNQQVIYEGSSGEQNLSNPSSASNASSNNDSVINP